jgi:hypothetical protein
MTSIPQSHRIDNYWGPFTTEAEAIETVVWNCGECRGVIWFKGGEYWSNDGIDSDTGKPWAALPESAFVVDMLEVVE